jgi:hypothetical protein
MKMLGRSPLVVLLLALCLISCSDDARPPDRPEGTGDPKIVPAGLPFGLGTIDGVTPLGQPAVSRSTTGQPGADVSADEVELTAVFRVEDGDAVAAFRTLVARLAGADDLQLGQIEVETGAEHNSGDGWLVASGSALSPADGSSVCCDGRGHDEFSLELWTTREDPVMVLHVTQRPGDGAATIPAEPFTADEPPESSLEWAVRNDGDVLFEEHGMTAVQLPPGARALMPTLPMPCGGGGSFSLFFAEDGRDAIQAMIQEVDAAEGTVETDGPHEQADGGSVILTALIDLGGPWIEIVSARGASDEMATLYVRSCVAEGP